MTYFVIDTIDGQFTNPAGDTFPAVVLAGDKDSVKEAARLFAERVIIIRADVEELAERIAEIIADTHDIDVTDDNYGVAVACNLLGIDPDEVYAARRKAREDAA